MFEEVTKRGCQPFNWLIRGFNYPIRLLKGQYVDQIREVDSPNTPLMGRPSALHSFFKDFVEPYNSSEWDINNTDGGGDTSEVCAVNDGVGGELTLTTNDAENDAEQRTYVTESFKLVSGKQLWFEARVKMSAATQSEMMLGLIKSEDLTGVSDLMPADGVVFTKDDEDTEIDFSSSKDGSQIEHTNEATLDTNYHRYGFHFDGAGTINEYIDGEKVGYAESNICDDEELAPSFMVKTGSAAARTMTIDYIHVVQQR